MVLKWSKGSRQALHTHNDLQAVDPNRLNSRVSGDPHSGQRIDRVSGTGAPGSRAVGGATPYSSSLRRPSSLIQSVVHAGESTSSTVTSWYPSPASASITSARIASIAGQPEYVGVIVTWTCPWAETSTSRRIPRSSIVRTGISGSGTAPATCRGSRGLPGDAGPPNQGRSFVATRPAPSTVGPASPVRPLPPRPVAPVTTRLRGGTGRGAASRPAGSPSARCGCLDGPL